jgi:hypothetical protein
MALVIEDGTGKTNSNSFVTAAEAKTYATDRGFSFPALDADVEPLLVKAADFLLGLEDQMKGLRTKQDQRLPFPRVRVLLFNNVDYIGSDEIPKRLKEVQMRLAVSAYANSNELVPDGTGQEVVREKVGPLEVQYAERGTGTVHPQFNQAMDLLAPFFEFGGGGQLVAERC